MTARPFVHLHCHSHYSLLDGAGLIERLVHRARDLQMTALALTDHGNLHGALEFYEKAQEAGIKPIIGYEAYVAPQSRFLKESDRKQEKNYHLTLLAQNRKGFENLLKLASAAYLEGFYYRPRIDKPLLEAHSEGLICLSGCISSEVNKALIGGEVPDMEKALAVAAWYQRVFGDRYYIEIQDNGMELQRRAGRYALEVARRLDIPAVATSDVHYVDRDDWETQDILICVNTKRLRAEHNRMRMETREFYLRSPEEMYAAFAGMEDAVARSQQIADRVEIDLPLGQRHFPVFVPPGAETSESYLRNLCIAGLKEAYADEPARLAEGELSAEVMDRLDRELAVINTLGFSNYFLIVWDFVRFARSEGIEASARGSGVGSLVAFGLGLSHVCPLKYDLLFERFLDENRKEAPDIDIDFCQERREEVIQYVRQKYGAANVSQIGTFGTMKARQAIHDVGRALNLPLARVGAVTALVPEDLKITIETALQKSDDLRKLYETDGEIRELIDLAGRLEGLARNIGTHAAGVVIGDRPLVEYVPLQRIVDKPDVITQWDMGDVERAGLLKMDFLGLRNLTILSKAVRLIEQTTGKRIDLYRLPLDDAQTFDLLCRGRTKGIFQFESGGIRNLLQRMKPDHFRDIIATNAMYRPGPLEGGMVDDYIEVKHGRKQPEYKHPVMKEVLEETHGVMVYQEQVMRILNRLGGIKLSSAYTCIKAISKKKLPIIAKFRDEFVEGAHRQGLSKKEAVDTFLLIEKFAGYGFNKSHSTAYAQIAFITAYLKAHYPVEFMAALLSSDISNRNFKRKDPLVEHIDDCRQMGVDVRPPDINVSQAEFSVAAGKVQFGLSAIKGCGQAASEAIAAERARGGPYRSLFNFCERIDAATVGRAAVESLVKAGAFDGLGPRAALLAAIDKAFVSGAAAAIDRRRGQKGLFDEVEEETAAADDAALPDLPEWDDREKAAKEKEVLGFYLSCHPLAAHQQTLETFCSHSIVEAVTLRDRSEVILGGAISGLKFSHTNKVPRPGEPTKYADFDLEDCSGVVRCKIWPRTLATCIDHVVPDAVVGAIGQIEKRTGGGEAILVINELVPLEQLESRYTRGILLKVSEDLHGQTGLERLYEILRGYPGRAEVELLLTLSSGLKVPCPCESLHVEVNRQMRDQVEALLGPENFQVLTASSGRRG